MDNNTVCENINIDECKELFEYEMTEVIIKLKGEFAAVSGCSKRYSEAAVTKAASILIFGRFHLSSFRTLQPFGLGRRRFQFVRLHRQMLRIFKRSLISFPHVPK